METLPSISSMSGVDAFGPNRLVGARRRRGLTTGALAASIGVERHAIAAYEAGEFAPRSDRLRRIARTLKLPERFFFGDDVGKLLPEAASFRSMSKRTARQRDRALGSAAVAVAFNQVIERLYVLPAANLPDIAGGTAPEQAALTVRRSWDLGEKPIESMMQLLEAKGARIYSLPADAVEIDTFSMWHQDRPLVFLNSPNSHDELRFDLAHELGHLVLHRHEAPASQDAQQAAIAFASAFLMPVAAIRADALGSATASQLASLGDTWGLSLTAVAHRLHKLELLSDWHYRRLRVEVAAERTDEGDGRPADRESPQLLCKIFAALRTRGVTTHRLAGVLHIYPKDVDEIACGLALRNTVDPKATPAP